MTLEEELDELVKMRDFMNNRIKLLRNKIRERSIDPDGFENEAPMFVKTSELSEYVRQVVDDGVSKADIAKAANVSLSTVENIYEDKTRWTMETIAESILIAIGMPHVYTNIELVKRTRKAPVVDRPPSQYFEE